MMASQPDKLKRAWKPSETSQKKTANVDWFKINCPFLKSHTSRTLLDLTLFN